MCKGLKKDRAAVGSYRFDDSSSEVSRWRREREETKRSGAREVGAKVVEIQKQRSRKREAAAASQQLYQVS